MSRVGKDSAEVFAFMTRFAELKNQSYDAPEKLADLAATDTSVKDLCKRVYAAADDLRTNERKWPALAAPVDPGFLAAWRDYEKRYESVLFTIVLTYSPGEFVNVPSLNADLNWKGADVGAALRALDIEAAMFALGCVTKFQDDIDNVYPFLALVHDESPEDSVERILRGVAEWGKLKEELGFDVRGVFRRRALVPFVLVTREVAAKHGSAEKLSMLRNLQQAHNAFVYGATYAALALMRSIMEAVLRDHYAAEGKDLSERINQARELLPNGANVAALHRLRKLANASLHLDSDKDEGLSKFEPIQLEKEIVSLLFVLRALIEGAPQWRPR